MEESSLICKCSHSKKDHQYPGDIKWYDSYCNKCMNRENYYNPVCLQFVSDNLKYLEWKYDQTQI